MLNLLVAMLALKGSFLFLLIAPLLVAQLLFSQGGTPGKMNQALPEVGRVRPLWPPVATASAGIQNGSTLQCIQKRNLYLKPVGASVSAPKPLPIDTSGRGNRRPYSAIMSPNLNVKIHQEQIAVLALAATPTETTHITVTAPRPGEALQGVVAISGTTDVPGFRSAEVDFAYQSDPTGTWFMVQQSSAPVTEGSLAAWDTTTITDGEYRLRVQVFLQNGQVMESVVSGVRVRNYTLIETSTPEARPAGQPMPTLTATPRSDFVVQPVEATPLPTNPAQLTPRNLQDSSLQGILLVFGAALAAAVYVGVRAITRR